MKVILDASYVAYRSLAGHRRDLGYYSDSGDWIYTGVIYSFLSDLILLLDRYKETTIHDFAIGWDSLPTRRLEIYSLYKANRVRDMSEEEELEKAAFKNQMVDLCEILPFVGIHCYKIDGVEADDIVASYAVQTALQVEMVACDKDLYQCISPLAWMYNFKCKLDRDWFVNKYRISPRQWISIQAMTGDVIDNIPGLRGVGNKTAIKMLKAGKSLKGAVRLFNSGEGYTDTMDSVLTSMRLVKLDTKLKLTPILEECDFPKFRRFLVSYRMKKILSQFDRFREFQK